MSVNEDTGRCQPLTVSILAADDRFNNKLSVSKCDCPHQALDMDYPADRCTPSQPGRAAAEQVLPLRLPAALTPAASPEASVTAAPATSASVEPAEPIREDADAPPAYVVYRGGPLEFDRVVPTSGNPAVRGKQFWLGPPGPGSPSPSGPIMT